MEQGKMNIPKLMLMFTTYTVLCLLGFFTAIESVLFPVFALPFALYVVSERPPIVLQVVFHIVMLGINFWSAQYDLIAIFIYLVSVVIPIAIIIFFYEQKLPLPNFIMYVAISLCVIVFIYFTILKFNGIDFEQVYINVIDSMKTLTNQMTDTMVKLEGVNTAITTEDVNLLMERQKLLSDLLEGMKAFYAYSIVTMIVSFSGLLMVIFNAILRRKNKELPSIKQLIQFRLSKVAVAILVFAMLLISVVSSEQNALLVLGMNLINVFVWLFRLTGGLGLVGLIYQSKTGNGLKILGYIGIGLAFIIFPYILMIFGCLDTFFNYRKIDIVV